MTPWMVWLIVAITFFIVEIFTPGFVIACLGIGALGAAVVALLGVSLTGQLIGFAVAALGAFLIIRPLYFRYLVHDSPSVQTNVQALVGRKGIVVEAIEPLAQHGRVKIGGEDWKASTADEQPVAQGQLVRVLRVEGATLIVEPINREENS